MVLASPTNTHADTNTHTNTHTLTFTLTRTYMRMCTHIRNCSHAAHLYTHTPYNKNCMHNRTITIKLHWLCRAIECFRVALDIQPHDSTFIQMGKVST